MLKVKNGVMDLLVIMPWSVMPPVIKGRKFLPTKNDRSMIIMLEMNMLLISTARIVGVFFFKDKIPEAIKEKTINGRQNPNISLNVRLKV